MKTNGTKYSPAFKLQVVLKVLKVEERKEQSPGSPGEPEALLLTPRTGCYVQQ